MLVNYEQSDINGRVGFASSDLIDNRLGFTLFSKVTDNCKVFSDIRVKPVNLRVLTKEEIILFASDFTKTYGKKCYLNSGFFFDNVQENDIIDNNLQFIKIGANRIMFTNEEALKFLRRLHG